MNESPIFRAVQAVGSQAELARQLRAAGVGTGKCSPAQINQWVLGRKPVPAEYVPTIERITAGKVRAEEFGHRVEWGYLRGTAAAAAV